VVFVLKKMKSSKLLDLQQDMLKMNFGSNHPIDTFRASPFSISTSNRALVVRQQWLHCEALDIVYWFVPHAWWQAAGVPPGWQVWLIYWCE
jgi:hypothetical protein